MRVRSLCLTIETVALLLPAAPAARAATVYFQDDFETDTSAGWNINQTSGNNSAEFGFDYSTLGVPSANGAGGTTRGLRLRANISGAVQAAAPGISVSPTGRSFTGDYNLVFKAWLNYNGPVNGGGNGSTQLMTAGVGTSGTTVQSHSSAHDSVWFAASGDGGTTDDYRAYPRAAYLSSSSPAYAAPGDNRTFSSNPHYASFGGVAAPAEQLDLFPGQTGISLVGSLGFEWHDVLISKQGNSVTWSIDGLPIATIDASAITLGGNNVFVGHSDINTGVSSDTNAPNMLFTLVDNVRVTEVPEPASLAAAGAAVAVLLRRRRR